MIKQKRNFPGIFPGILYTHPDRDGQLPTSSGPVCQQITPTSAPTSSQTLSHIRPVRQQGLYMTANKQHTMNQQQHQDNHKTEKSYINLGYGNQQWGTSHRKMSTYDWSYMIYHIWCSHMIVHIWFSVYDYHIWLLICDFDIYSYMINHIWTHMHVHRGYRTHTDPETDSDGQGRSGSAQITAFIQFDGGIVRQSEGVVIRWLSKSSLSRENDHKDRSLCDYPLSSNHCLWEWSDAGRRRDCSEFVVLGIELMTGTCGVIMLSYKIVQLLSNLRLKHVMIIGYDSIKGHVNIYQDPSTGHMLQTVQIVWQLNLIHWLWKSRIWVHIWFNNSHIWFSDSYMSITYDCRYMITHIWFYRCHRIWFSVWMI